jgi:ketosteroid isomerase-like protein
MVSADDGQQVSPNVKPEYELKLANEEWARALANRDGAALDQIMSQDFVLAYPFEGDDKGQFIADVLAGEVKVDSLLGHDVTIRVSGATGLIFGSETANWHYRGRDLSGGYRFLRVYSKHDGRWQIVALHLCARVLH